MFGAAAPLFSNASVRLYSGLQDRGFDWVACSDVCGRVFNLCDLAAFEIAKVCCLVGCTACCIVHIQITEEMYRLLFEEQSC